MAKGNSSKRPKVVPGCEQALDQMKYEIASELGIQINNARPNSFSGYGFDAEFGQELGEEGVNSAANSNNQEEYWGYVSTRDAGAVGGEITRSLVREAQQMGIKL